MVVTFIRGMAVLAMVIVILPRNHLSIYPHTRLSQASLLVVTYSGLDLYLCFNLTKSSLI